MSDWLWKPSDSNRLGMRGTKDEAALLHRFDLLADGELNTAERKNLLEHCESEPRLWKACAMAFLQAQAFHEGFSAPKSERRPAGIAQDASGARPAYLAMAAMVIIAFGLGGMWTQWNFRGQPQPAHGTRLLAPDASLLAQGTATGVGRPGLTPTYTSANMFGDMQSATVLVPSKRGFRPVRIPIQTDDSTPVEESNELWSPELIQQLETLGFEVKERRRSLPAQLKDGRLLFIPVDEVEISDKHAHVEIAPEEEPANQYHDYQ